MIQSNPDKVHSTGLQKSCTIPKVALYAGQALKSFKCDFSLVNLFGIIRPADTYITIDGFAHYAQKSVIFSALDFRLIVRKFDLQGDRKQQRLLLYCRSMREQCSNPLTHLGE